MFRGSERLGEPFTRQARTSSAAELGPRGRRICFASRRGSSREILRSSMSRQNVEIVRRLFEVIGRGDSDAVLALYDPDIEFDSSRTPLPRLIGGDGVQRGHQALRRFFRERAEAWESIEDRCEELIDAGEAVISVVTVRGRGRTTGIEVETRMAGVWTVRDNKLVRVVWFPTRAEALEAARLSG